MNQTPEQLTDFANVEEDFADSAVWEMKLLPRDKHVMPWRIEDEMKKIGANYIQAGLFESSHSGPWRVINDEEPVGPVSTAKLWHTSAPFWDWKPAPFTKLIELSARCSAQKLFTER